MKNYITVDGGTTNTRVCLVCGDKITKTEKIAMGARDCTDGNERLKNEIKEKIKSLLSESRLADRDIEAVIASGMITSEYGLCELKHLNAPAGVKELHAGMKRVVFEDITDIPFYFIPGIKTGTDSPETADMMRGEETELFGMITEDTRDFVYVLPGSHSKLVFLDESGRISSFKTMLTGEMIAALSGHTILKSAVNLNVAGCDSEYLLMGYDYCSAHGINEALFKTRILKNLFGKSDIQTYSYFLGIILTGETDALKSCGKEGVVIGGKSQLKKAMSSILSARSGLKVICADDAAADCAAALGAIKIYEYR